MTWIQACRHITNYSAGHESRTHLVGEARLAYPPDHIEADNRLSWLLGRLDETYGDDAFYVHLRRERQATARSFARRRDFGILRAYGEGILLGSDPDIDPLILALDYLETVEANIRLFLRDKSRVMEARLENLEADFRRFWEAIGAEGDLEAALAELKVRHNASVTDVPGGSPHPSPLPKGEGEPD